MHSNDVHFAVEVLVHWSNLTVQMTHQSPYVYNRSAVSAANHVKMSETLPLLVLSCLFHTADILPPSPSGVGSRSCIACPEGTWADETGFQCVQCGVSSCQQCTIVGLHTHAHMHTGTHAHRHTGTQAHRHTGTHAHMCTHTHKCMHASTSTLTHSSFSNHFCRWLMVFVLPQRSSLPLLVCSATTVSTSVQL